MKPLQVYMQKQNRCINTMKGYRSKNDALSNFNLMFILYLYIYDEKVAQLLIY